MMSPIEEPLWDMMISTHSCYPGCGCDADFDIDFKRIRHWIDDLGDDFGREALRQIDELLARAPEIQEALGAQRGRGFRPPETAKAWLNRWRAATIAALGGRNKAGLDQARR